MHAKSIVRLCVARRLASRSASSSAGWTSLRIMEILALLHAIAGKWRWRIERSHAIRLAREEADFYGLPEGRKNKGNNNEKPS